MNDAAWQLLAVGSAVVVALIGAIYALLLWEIRRVGRNVHSLRTEIGSLLLPIETQVRELERTLDRITGQMEEASSWREMVLELIRGRQ